MSKVQARLLADGVQELHDGVGQHQRELVAAQPRHRLGERGDRVVVMDHRAVARSAARGQPHPVHALLRGLDQIEPPLTTVAARHRQRKPADLADRLGDALEQVGPVVHQPLRPVFAAVLLVGHEREHQVARRDDAGPTEMPGNDDHHADHVLHVDRAAAPDIAVLDRAGERMHAPLGRLGGHHVKMPVDQQRAARAVRALEAGEHIAAPGRAGLQVLDLVADVFQLGGDPVGAFGLALGGFQLAGVGGVEPDQPADNVDHVVDRSLGWHRHSHLSYH